MTREKVFWMLAVCWIFAVSLNWPLVLRTLVIVFSTVLLMQVACRLLHFRSS